MSLNRLRFLRSLTVQIVAGLLLGGLLGWLWPEFGQRLEILATIFIRLVLMVIAPLIFSTLVVGIAGTERRRLGSLALHTVAYFLVLTLIALAFGFALGNLFQPGVGLAPPAQRAEVPLAAGEESFWVRLFPTSIVDAMARGDVLQIVVFTLLFAVALALVGERARPVLDLCRSLADVMYRFTDIVMRAAPVGVLGAAAALVAQQGLQVGENFFWLTLAVYLGLALLLFGLYPLLAVWFGLPVGAFFRALKEPFAIAFATTSSAAALPKAMEAMEKFGVPRRAVAFVLPAGTALNLAGSALFIAVAGFFLLQAFHIPLSFSDQLSFFVVLLVASKSVTNVPRSSLVALAAGLSGFGVEPEVVAVGFGFLLGIDPILDMPRTGVNTAGNCLAAALIARWQGTFHPAGR